jgi:hypothetical protein
VTKVGTGTQERLNPRFLIPKATNAKSNPEPALGTSARGAIMVPTLPCSTCRIHALAYNLTMAASTLVSNHRPTLL